ncbi:unnamed protein product [Cyclocybe aegerita]|uniref:Uncharacterized protein n=1 Tax=Cyclocybe aegerita TaxID=1973307 RepID=A0A8S0WTV4_CYCAE|nr:unnamed protein product [Cyclocybe aegerita]
MAVGPPCPANWRTSGLCWMTISNDKPSSIATNTTLLRLSAAIQRQNANIRSPAMSHKPAVCHHLSHACARFCPSPSPAPAPSPSHSSLPAHSPTLAHSPTPPLHPAHETTSHRLRHRSPDLLLPLQLLPSTTPPPAYALPCLLPSMLGAMASHRCRAQEDGDKWMMSMTA